MGSQRQTQIPYWRARGIGSQGGPKLNRVIRLLGGAGAAGMWLVLMGFVMGASVASQGVGRMLVEPDEACLDFDGGRKYPGSSWTLEDCMHVWKHFVRSVPRHLHLRPRAVDIWRETAGILRQQGSPCLIASIPAAGGVGSSTIRHLSTWIFAEQMGCDWVTPEWGRSRDPRDGGAVLYCHKVATTEEIGQAIKQREADDIRRCSLINWMEFFQLDVQSVDHPDQQTFRTIEASLEKTDTLVGLRAEVQHRGISSMRLDHVLFTSNATFAGQHLLAIGSWDETKREIVRKVLQEARFNFHHHPRQRNDEDITCAFEPKRLNFALHVRMGDRREFQDGSTEYFELLELLMVSISEAVTAKKLLPPMFHVFSETLAPCPSKFTRLFHEFPAWPVEADEISRCWDAKTPQDCPEKQAGAKLCNADRSGVFFVEGRPIVLHVGRDVGNAMSCMIKSDGIVMGCSAFGQVAGLFTKGIRFFSIQCYGTNTPEQLKTIPPLAIAERGHLWVPISGSWRDPVLVSSDILDGALEALLDRII